MSLVKDTEAVSKGRNNVESCKIAHALALTVTLCASSPLYPSLAQQILPEPVLEVDQIEVGELGNKLIELDKYMTRKLGTDIVTFDVETAKRGDTFFGIRYRMQNI